MIICMTFGGESTITVYGPAGSSISASGGGESILTSIPSGSTSVSFNVHTIATWRVYCTYNGVQKYVDVSITSFGESKSASFSYASIAVYTQPGATVTASKTGYSLGPVTADSSGYCVLAVDNPDALNSTAWNVVAKNSSNIQETKTATTNSYTAAPSVYPLYYVPIIQVTHGGTTYTYNGAALNTGTVVISAISSNSWKFWLYGSCTVKFVYIRTNTSIWGIGKGGNGGAKFSVSGGWYGGGGGGGGGKVVSGTYAVAGNTYSVTVDATGSYFGNLLSATNGENGGSPTGGNSGGGSGNGDGGEWVNDHSYPPSSGGGGDGGNGVYAFGDSSFDGVVYGHGGGGGHHSSYSGYSSGTRGSGGGGQGGASGVAGTGVIGVICMKNA